MNEVNDLFQHFYNYFTKIKFTDRDFSYVNGTVKELNVTTEDANWSINIKRAILFLLQIRLDNQDDPSKTDDLTKYGSATFDIEEVH